MSPLTPDDAARFRDALQDLQAGNFSRLSPLFESLTNSSRSPIIEWYDAGRFKNHQSALDEAFTCACFLGRTSVVAYFLARGVDSSGGSGTGLDAFHWAANRGQLDVVRLLIQHTAHIETRSRYGGTVLGTAVWSAIHEPKPDHLPIIQALIEAGARLEEAGYPTGNQPLDDLLRRYGAKA